MHRFIAASPYLTGTEVILDPEQSHHLAKVLRLEEGERVGLIDGQGSFALAVLTEVRPKSVRAKVERVQSAGVRSRIQVCFGVPKGQALDFIYRRLPELGVASLQPLQTRFSSPAKAWNPERWENVISEVCKQCEELFFPASQPLVSLSVWLKTRNPEAVLVLCDENARAEEVALPSDKPIDLLVGAEGGFHEEEVRTLLEAGAVRLGLGRNRLRAETAALVALTLVKERAGEIGTAAKR